MIDAYDERQVELLIEAVRNNKPSAIANRKRRVLHALDSRCCNRCRDLAVKLQAALADNARLVHENETLQIAIRKLCEGKASA